MQICLESITVLKRISNCWLLLLVSDYTIDFKIPSLCTGIPNYITETGCTKKLGIALNSIQRMFL